MLLLREATVTWLGTVSPACIMHVDLETIQGQGHGMSKPCTLVVMTVRPIERLFGLVPFNLMTVGVVRLQNLLLAVILTTLDIDRQLFIYGNFCE